MDLNLKSGSGPLAEGLGQVTPHFPHLHSGLTVATVKLLMSVESRAG
jgi:hypothetical protein